jgi:2-dehydro-3-deoxy-D-arabinonate dehydratase
LVLNSHLQLVGFTVGNDMSSRDIEGENPLYLPQAKIYDACCSLGPCVTLPVAMPPEDEIDIEMVIRRGEDVLYEGKTSAGQMARSFDNLISWLGRESSFPTGVFLLTGTGIVPDNEFTLQEHDVVEITIAGIGTLINPVE